MSEGFVFIYGPELELRKISSGSELEVIHDLELIKEIQNEINTESLELLGLINSFPNFEDKSILIDYPRIEDPIRNPFNLFLDSFSIVKNKL